MTELASELLDAEISDAEAQFRRANAERTSG
jgi:hypothetical protein